MTRHSTLGSYLKHSRALLGMISSLSFNLGNVQVTMSVKDCYQYDFDWPLLPDSLRKVSLVLLPSALYFTIETMKWF